MRALLMRLTLLSTLLLVVACDRKLAARPPVEFRLYYPSGAAFVPPATDAGVGRLYVANSNFDRRFDVAWLTALDLAQVRTVDGRSLPPPGAPIPGPLDGGSDQGRPVQFSQLATTGANIVNISSFAGLATVDLRRNRLFVPSRAEGDQLAVMDITPDGGPSVSCFFSGGADCTVDALQLAVAQTPGAFGIPSAPEPYSVSLAPEADRDEVYVTHLRPASSPAQSVTNLQNYLVTLHQFDLETARAAYRTSGGYVVPDSAFSPIGRGASNSIVVEDNFLFVSGRGKLASTDPDVLLRIVERDSNLVAFPQLQLVWASNDARALQYRPADGKHPARIYLAVDNPAALLVLDVSAPPAPELPPSVALVRAVPLPEGPNDVQIIDRTGHAPLVIVSCSVDGSLAFYDDDLGQIAALVPGVGAVPFAIAVDRRGDDYARLYVSNFGDGRIAVVDIPLSTASAGGRLAPRLVAHIGQKQYCLIATDDRNCVDTNP